MAAGPERERRATPDEGLSSAINLIARRLKSQPLLLAFGVLLVLALVATTAKESLHEFRPVALVVFVVAVAAWLAVEFMRVRKATTEKETSGIEVSAKRVGKSGEVTAIDAELGEGQSIPGGGVKIDASDIKGKVKGVQVRRPGQGK